MTAARVRVALIGMGRMGQAIDALAGAREVDIVARLDAADVARGLDTRALNGADVAIEFSVPESAVPNAIACLREGCPVVIGTTGWSEHRPQLERAVVQYGCPALWSPNFSIGVQLFLAVVEEAARRFRAVEGFDAHIVETHHAAKLDAPSGTAIAIRERAQHGLQRDVGVTSVRVGSVPGTHAIVFDGAFEQVRLVHEARDRRVFADGAIAAARWLSRRPVAALYTMRDVLETNYPATSEPQ